MSDLVKRLRELSGPRYPDDICGKQLMGSASARIEALEAVLRQAREAQNRIVDAFANSYSPQTRADCFDQVRKSVAAIDAALKE